MISSVSQENLANETDLRLHNTSLYSEKLWKSSNSLDLSAIYGIQQNTSRYTSFTTDDIREGSYFDARTSMSKALSLAQKYVRFCCSYFIQTINLL